jgi:catechol 2,3-dioxygenase-like lactoylglutathione lyase family enzyme
MKRHLSLAAVVVRDYDEAIAFYTKTLGFDLIEDTFLPDEGKRWVVVAPPGGTGGRLLLARAVGNHQESRVGDQTGGRVAFFLYTDDFWRDYGTFQENGVVFVGQPKVASYGTVAVFRDLYGNLWDLLEPRTE